MPSKTVKIAVLEPSSPGNGQKSILNAVGF
jgi:hypothetical protein